ncbi:Hsp70 family protein [Thermomonospora umbrina]|uniref:Molecular chaperone DnaK (HSP70) n=1 Tax=Thermomonospora umbrina TaxID=111806 RepID=A0A3D9SMP9_9ACTN|nr:Hsp70 family protein [Thermomonospora umbrina]REE97202.1 molecular chaperone DnaK (HSP70) [Thermomonospora umbrina]
MPTFGIDLGTTYSCIAYMDAAGRPVIAKNAVGEDTTPSVVYFETPENVVVGADAKKSALLDPDRVVQLIKRQMGEKLELEFDGVPHTPESISGLILKELARAAAELTHEEVKDVVITVPAYFGVQERQATRNAGEIAGLNVLNMVPEPVAAALHYEAMGGEDNRTILVYDLGGGTFDTTVIRLEGSDVHVVCTDGNHRLGGADWDDRIADHLLEGFLAENPGSTAASSEDFLQEIALAAEELKKGLSRTLTRRHNMRFDGGVARVELSRERFEELTADLLEQTLEITARTVAAAAERGVHSFDDVLLVGGSTRMPAVEAGLRERFGFEPKLYDPDLAVAKGAARFALIESIKLRFADEADEAESLDESAVAEVADQLNLDATEVRRLAGKRVTSAVPRAFGVKVLVGKKPERFAIQHVLKANTALPATPDPERLGTAWPNQTEVDVEIWEQAGPVESENLADNKKIGEGTISGMPPLPEGSPLDVTFGMDEMGTLRVYAIELTTRKDLEIELKIEGLSADDVVEARKHVGRYELSE